jgi:cytochrome P450
MSWLHRDGQLLERVRSELGEPNGTDKALDSPLFEGICAEALRLNPIVPDFLRVFDVPLELEEATLPAGSGVAVVTCLVHQDPEIYPEPERFDPDRWQRPVRPYEFLAFGGGVRRCIGAAMAVMEMKIALAEWLSRFEFRLPPDAPAVEPVWRRNLTMAPRTGIPLQMVRTFEP